MIFYSDSLIKTWQPNLIMLDLEDDLGHIYVTRNTYDQAVLIADRFNYDVSLVEAKLGGSLDQQDAAAYMSAILPKPINILAPFYHLIGPEVELNVDDVRQTVGVLSYISMSIDFNMMLKVDASIRSNLKFTKSILLEYQSHFEDFTFSINDSSISSVSSSSRKNREDFELEEVKEEEELDVDAFLADIGWDDIPSYSDISLAPKVETPSTVVEPKAEAETEAEGYMAIIGKFSS